MACRVIGSAGRLCYRGISLIELLISLAITSSLSVVVFGTLSPLVTSLHRINTLVEDELAVAQVAQNIKRAIDAYDQHLLWLPPKIFQNGVLLNADGQRVQITNNQLLQPSRTSSIISYLSIDLSNLMQSTTCSNLSVCTACSPDVGRQRSLSDIKSLWGITLEASAEYSFRVSTQSGRCKTFALNKVPSMHAVGSVTQPRLLIPIRDSHALYLASNNTYRLLNFTGTTIIENQPLTSSIKDVKITANNSAPFQLLITIETTSGTKHVQNLFSKRIHSGGASLILNNLL